MGTNCRLHSDRGVQKLLQDLDRLLHESQSADTVFFVGVKEVPMPCHSFMLKQRCKNYRSEPHQQRFPSTSPEIFQLFLGYVYTGRLAVEESCLLDLLCLAAEFGMEDLEETCEQLIYSTTEGSPTKACNILGGALAKKRKIGGCPCPRALQSIIANCTRLIGESPAELFQSPKFLSIPSDSLVAIISSDQLCLEEEQIWRYVLKWAQYNAGVDAPVREWSEEERVAVAKYLSPVIGHVRLLLIDSRIFAEEVEPTGCVPMALSLERYRFAALQTQGGGGGSGTLRPRKAPKLFQSSLIINSTGLARKLNEWHAQIQEGGASASWKCIFRASLHGFSAEAFHKHCDGQAPTYTVVQVQGGVGAWVCGGYTDVPWAKPRIPKYVASSKSFLFSCNGRDGDMQQQPQPVVRFKVKRPHFAVCHHEESGPIFGAGADLYIGPHCDAPEPGTEAYSNIGHSYGVVAADEEQQGENIGFAGQNGGGGTLGRKAPPPPNPRSQIHASVSESGARLTPTYSFVVADYEVFVPIAGAATFATAAEECVNVNGHQKTNGFN